MKVFLWLIDEECFTMVIVSVYVAHFFFCFHSDLVTVSGGGLQFSYKMGKTQQRMRHPSPHPSGDELSFCVVCNSFLYLAVSRFSKITARNVSKVGSLRLM